MNYNLHMVENQSLQHRAAWYTFKMFAALRIGTWLWVLLFSMVGGRTIIEPDVLCKSGSLLENNLNLNVILHSAIRWDATCYLLIAEHGYNFQPGLTVWPPLYPILIRIFAVVFQPFIMAALIVSSLATWLAFFLLYLIIEKQYNEELARNTLFLYVIYPLSFFFVSGYTESIFLCLTILSLWMIQRHSWAWAGISSAFATLTRNQGILLSLVLLYEGIYVPFFQKKEKSWNQFFQVLVSASLPVLVFLGFALYVHYSLRIEWPWQTLGRIWAQSTGFPWDGIIGNIKRLFTLPTSTDLYWLPTTIVDLIMAIIMPVVLVWKEKSMPSSYKVYAWSMLLLSLMKLGPDNILVSFSRYALIIFPFFAVLAPVVAKPRSRMFLFTLCLISQGMLIYMFYIWSWAG